MFGIKLSFWIALLLFVVILFIIKGSMGITTTEGMETKEGIDETVSGSKKTTTSISTIGTS